MTEKRLLIVETLSEARLLVEGPLAGKNLVKGCDLLCLDPNIRSYLKERGIESLSTYDRMDAPAHRAVMDKCEDMEHDIRKELRKRGIQDPPDYFTNAFWHFLRLIWRHLLWNIELVDHCLERDAYKHVFAFQYGRVVTHSPWIEDDQLYMGDIAGSLCRSREMEFSALQPPSLPERTLAEKMPPGAYRTACNALAYHLFRITEHTLSRRKTILVPSFKYNMNRVCDELAGKDRNLKIGIFYLGKKGVEEVLHALAILFHVMTGRKMYKPSVGYPVDFAFPILTFARYHARSYSDRHEREYIDATVKAIEDGKAAFKGVGLSDFLVQKIREDLKTYMLDIRFQAFGLEKLMEAFKPDCIISQMSGEIYGALGTAAKKMSVPSILISHGSHVYHQDKYSARENDILARNILVGDYQYSAVQSPLAREIASEMMKDPARIVNIKPSLWGRAVNRIHHKKDIITIVHASSLKLRHNRRFIYETSDEFLQGMAELIEAIAPFPRLHLILKIRPDIYELSMETMKALLPTKGNVIVETDKSFLDVLPEADLVVSFSSTTIEEALSNKVPVLLYGGHGRYAHIPIEHFSETNNDIAKAVTFVKDRELLKTYMAALNENASSFNVPDEAFSNYRFSDSEVVDLTEWIMSLCSE